ncbi:MAG: hypothetical protein WC022_02655 [Parcubacteria group bacterium]
MKKIFNLKSFWIVFILATIAIFVVGINARRAYRSETTILIIPKSEAAARNSDQIIENLSQLPTTLSFYARMTKDNEDAADETIAELPDYKKKTYWNSELRVARVGTSGILKFIATDSDRYQAEIISSQAAASLIGMVGLYYDIENDLDVRIIDPVITDYANGAFDLWLFIESILGFFLLETILFYCGTVFFKKERVLQIGRPKFFFPYGKTDAVLSPEPEKEEKRETVLPLDRKWSIEDKPYTDFVKTQKTSSAPANLPVAEKDNFPMQSETETSSLVETLASVEENQVPETEMKAPQAEMPITREATAEEVKARLNKLLSGQL